MASNDMREWVGRAQYTPGTNLYLTIEQYFSQSFPYLIAHLGLLGVSRSRITGVREDVPLEVASATVNEDSNEEDGVEVRDGGAQALAETPRETHGPIRDVVLFIKVSTRFETVACMTRTGLREYAHQPSVRRRLP